MKNVDYQVRKERVLGIVVNEYIKTVSPVSSSFIAQEYLPDLSSATIRNILAELENEGYLTHPHVSAGRIPTQDGYRFYVDNLMFEIKLLEEEKARIKEEYDQGVKDLEALLEKTSQLLSDMTHYTSIVSVDCWQGRLFCRGTNYVVTYPEYQDIQKIRGILVILEEKERLLSIINQELEKKVKILIGSEIACESISDSCALAVSSFRTSLGACGRIAVLGPQRMDYARVVSALDYLKSVIEEIM
ncbi:MAG TPA: hypothetical protein PLT76_06750 [Candidatus Omnitrophota bacterium]|nr:hypothetical protein [Candidatus Omnitrophota bacterium]HQO58405.1 hypothetical protein [Candidatus Omnitrophota bacterium]HQP11874.1 hypothetical protein [Candidatus Omnitrophota bacterium]